MTTLHANSPRDMLARLEGLVLMAVEMPVAVIRRNIASAVQLVVQIVRLSDGSRKIERISEVQGVAGDEIVTRDIFVFEQTGVSRDGRVEGAFRATGYVPACVERLRAAGLDVEAALFAADPTESEGAGPVVRSPGEQTRERSA